MYSTKQYNFEPHTYIYIHMMYVHIHVWIQKYVHMYTMYESNTHNYVIVVINTKTWCPTSTMYFTMSLRIERVFLMSRMEYGLEWWNEMMEQLQLWVLHQWTLHDSARGFMNPVQSGTAFSPIVLENDLSPLDNFCKVYTISLGLSRLWIVKNSYRLV